MKSCCKIQDDQMYEWDLESRFLIRLHFRVSCNREATKVTLGSHHHPPQVHLIDHNQYYQYNVGEATLRNKSTKGGRGPKFATPSSPTNWFTEGRLFLKPNNNKCFCSKSLCLSQPFLVLVGPFLGLIGAKTPILPLFR